MPLLNYTTSVAADKTAGEIIQLLAKAGARQILTDYGPDGSVTGLSFMVDGTLGRRSYSLPVDPASVYEALYRTGVPGRYLTIEQAERVAWRILKDWIEAQLAIIESQMVTLDQVMLPYMHTDGNQGMTVYELYRAQQPALPDGST